MRILWILPYSPWPTTSGGKTRQYHLLRSLAARGHRITVLLHSKQPVSAEDRQALEPFLERLVVLPRRPLRSLSTLLAALFAPYPLLASVNGLSAELQRTAKELLREPGTWSRSSTAIASSPTSDRCATPASRSCSPSTTSSRPSVPPPTTVCRAGRCPSCATTSGVTAAGNAG